MDTSEYPCQIEPLTPAPSGGYSKIPLTAAGKVDVDTSSASTGTAPFTAQLTTTAAAAVKLHATSVPCKQGFLVRNLDAAASVWVGAVGVDNTTGYVILPGEQLPVPLSDVSELYVYAGADTTPMVAWIAVN